MDNSAGVVNKKIRSTVQPASVMNTLKFGLTRFAFQVLLNTIYLINSFGLGTKMSIDFEPERLVLQWFPPLPIAYAQLKNQQHSVTLTIPAMKIRQVFITFQRNNGSHASS